MSELLRLDGIRAGYGSAGVLHGVDLVVDEGQIVVLLGANGVGKTTTLRTIMGGVAPTAGTVTYDGGPVGRAIPERLVRRGIGIVPEPPAVFGDMSVAQNLAVGAFAAPVGAGGARRRQDRTAEMLQRFPRLGERRHQRAGSLSGGEQRTLAVARALMGEPRLLLVDEVSAGLSPTAIGQVLALLADLRAQGLTILMVEQNVAALDIADAAYVMEKGTIVHHAAGDLGGVRAAVSRAYLGDGHGAAA